MTIGGNTLRDLIARHQVENDPLHILYDNLLTLSGYVRLECFHDMEAFPVPLLSLELYEEKWRGKYQSSGPFGLPDVITINLNGQGMNEGMDLLRTLAHELGHWWMKHKCPERSGHGGIWQNLMVNRCGLEFDANGRLVRELGEWWDLTSGWTPYLANIDEFIQSCVAQR